MLKYCLRNWLPTVRSFFNIRSLSSVCPPPANSVKVCGSQAVEEKQRNQGTAAMNLGW